MKQKVIPLFITAVVILILVQACAPVSQGIDPPIGETSNGDAVAPEGVGLARDAALDYIIQHHANQLSPSPGTNWVEQNLTPQELLGAMTYRFTVQNLIVTVSFPVVASDAILYQVIVENSATGFLWQGEVNSSGQVKELAVSEIRDTNQSGSTVDADGGLGSDLFTLTDHADARNAVLAYVYNRYLPDSNSYPPPAELPWDVMEVGAAVASYAFEYTNSDWEVRVEAEASAPYPQLYQVQVTCLSLGFTWMGTVDHLGNITETQSPLPVVEPVSPASGVTDVVGWFGYIESLPAGAQWDDRLVLANSAGAVGIDGQTEQIRSEIIVLRDQPEPGKYAHFWGTLSCGVPDYGGCQLVVNRIRSGSTFTEEEPLAAWQGTLVSNPPASQFDDYFVLTGDFPLPYGIHSLDPALQTQLESLRDTGQTFMVWGVLRTGVPDAYGSQIQVAQIELIP